jgi:hypothetical protein
MLNNNQSGMMAIRIAGFHSQNVTVLDFVVDHALLVWNIFFHGETFSVFISNGIYAKYN